MNLSRVSRGPKQAVSVLREIEDCVREEEREDVVTLLRREECDHIRCNRPEMAAYVAELIAKLERGEHR